jgi:hypothetical protein
MRAHCSQRLASSVVVGSRAHAHIGCGVISLAAVPYMSPPDLLAASTLAAVLRTVRYASGTQCYCKQCSPPPLLTEKFTGEPLPVATPVSPRLVPTELVRGAYVALCATAGPCGHGPHYRGRALCVVRQLRHHTLAECLVTTCRLHI